jgi:hypothetical protein
VLIDVAKSGIAEVAGSLALRAAASAVAVVTLLSHSFSFAFSKTN